MLTVSYELNPNFTLPSPDTPRYLNHSSTFHGFHVTSDSPSRLT